MWLDCEKTQEQIADALAVPRNTVANWLAQTRNSADLGKPPGATDGKPRGSVQQTEIAEQTGVPRETIKGWVAKRERSSEITTPPGKTDKKPLSSPDSRCQVV